MKKKKKIHIQKGTYPITKLPSSISTSINPSSILRLCVEALPWAKSMSSVVVNVGHVSDDTVSQPFLTTFWLQCKTSTRKKKKHFQLRISVMLTILKQKFHCPILFLNYYFWLLKWFKKTKKSFLWFSHIGLGKIRHIQMKLILYDKPSEWEVNSFCRPHFRISALFWLHPCHSVAWKARPRTRLTDESLHTSLLFDILPPRSFCLSPPFPFFSFQSLRPSHKHTQNPLDLSPSPFALSICQAKWRPRQKRRRLTQWSESNGKRRRVAEEERSDGCQGRSMGDRRVKDGEREAWGAWCGFFLTGWSLLWADPLPAGSHVSWMCAGWGRVEKRRHKK